MNSPQYVRDTSASQRARAIYLTTGDQNCYNHNGRRSDEDYYHRDVIKESKVTKWDEMSTDSGFCSDIDKRVAQLNISGTDVSSVDDITGKVVISDDVRAPSRAKLSEEEKRKRAKIRTLPTPGTAVRWYRCDDVTEDYSDDDGDAYDDELPGMPNHKSARRSRSLPSHGQVRRKAITWDDVTLSDLLHLGVLGGGGYSRVDLVEIRRVPGPKFALKKLNKHLLQRKNQVQHTISEKEALLQARSRFIPRLFRTFQTTNHVFMLGEACMGGDLFSVLEHHGALPHDVACYITACVIEALDHLHRVMNFVHRDVKTENILIDSNGVAKLGDLGLCKHLGSNCDVTQTFCGTRGYAAPEILLRVGHGRSCDFFSTGVVMFESVTCRSPFRRQSTNETHRATLRGIKEVAFPPYVRSVAAHLISSLCENDPRRRLGVMGCDEVRRHDCFRQFDWERLRQGRMTSPLRIFLSRPHPSTSEQRISEHSDNLTSVRGEEVHPEWSEHF